VGKRSFPTGIPKQSLGTRKARLPPDDQKSFAHPRAGGRRGHRPV